MLFAEFAEESFVVCVHSSHCGLKGIGSTPTKYLAGDLIRGLDHERYCDGSSM